MALGLTEKILALHHHLEAARLPHAFGGALALAFCTAEPRATKDIDVNVFMRTDQVDELVSALPSDVTVADEARLRLSRDAQARLWWHGTPVDVFLSNHPFHDQAEANRRLVPFAGVELPVLACTDLAVFKAFFARPKDAVDLATMVKVGSIDLPRLRSTVADLLGDDADRARFFERVEENLASSDAGP